MKFKSKIVAATAGILLLSLSVLSTNQYLEVRTRVDEQVKGTVDSVASELANNIAAIVDDKKKLGRYVMDLIDDDISETNIERVYSKSVIKQEFVLAGVGFESDGHLVDNDPNWVAAANYDSRTRPWYIDAKNANELILTAPYADSVTKEIVVSMGIPMIDDGQFVGAMFLDVSLKGLGEIVNRVKPLDAGYAFLVSDNGTMISHPQTALNGNPMSDHFGSNLLPNKQFQQLDVDGQALLIKFVKVPNVDWYLGVALDEDTINQTANSLRNQAIMYSLIAIILGTLAIITLIAKLMRPLDEIAQAMKEIAIGDGDLTQRLSTDGDQEFAVLAQGFNGFTQRLQVLIADSKNLSEQITKGTEDTAEVAIDSSGAMNKQLAELEQLATAMTEMSSTSLEVAGYAQQAASSAGEADNAASNGADTVSLTSESILQLSHHIENAVAEVKQLEESTGSIETILSVISGIAEQTNLLALNAAIEAARAGEQGRGFAVVADEVRNLAQRTQESTAEIKTKIEQLQQSSRSVASVMAKSQAEATDSVDKAQQANTALKNISGAINKITEMNLQIAAAAEQQSSVAEEININTINIKDLSQQVADSATVTNDAMVLQKQITQQQYEVLSRFVI